MNHVLAGVEAALHNSKDITRLIPESRIIVWSDVNMVPPGFKWPYIVIKDGDSPTRQLMSEQQEEFLNVEIYICHRSFSKAGAAQLLGNAEGDGSIGQLTQTILDILNQDVWRQWALQGYYTGTIPIQCLSVSVEPRSEPFTPRGESVSTEWSAVRKRIDVHYYRYTVHEVSA